VAMLTLEDLEQAAVHSQGMIWSVSVTSPVG
jgi:hypothetical protein